MPIRDSIHIMPGSDIESGEMPNYTSLKTTLIGDYSHTQMAWKKHSTTFPTIIWSAIARVK